MGIDQFTREQFEAALPVDKESGKPLWEHLGLKDGEHVYAIPVKRKDEAPVRIVIRSSVGPHEKAYSSGNDSIRMWLEAGYQEEDYERVKWDERQWSTKTAVKGLRTRTDGTKIAWVAVGKNVNRWLTRRPGWADRMLPLLREMYAVGVKEIDRCPICQNWRVFRKVKKDGPNKGRIFTTCWVCDTGFKWVTEAKK